MRLGPKARVRPAEEYFQVAHELGFNWVELGCEAPINFPRRFDDQRIAKVRDLSQKYCMDFSVHSASFVNTAEFTPGMHEASVEHLLEYLDVACKMGADHLVIHCGFHFSQLMDDTYSALLDCFRKVVDVAERKKMPLMIENMNLLPVEAEIRYLGTTIEELQIVFDAIDSPYLGLALDVGHANLFPDGVFNFLDTFASRIGGLHLHDNDGVIDRHWAMGSGTVNWPAFFARLKEMDYQGGYTIELSDPNAVLASRDYLKKIGIMQ